MARCAQRSCFWLFIWAGGEGRHDAKILSIRMTTWTSSRSSVRLLRADRISFTRSRPANMNRRHAQVEQKNCFNWPETCLSSTFGCSRASESRPSRAEIGCGQCPHLRLFGLRRTSAGLARIPHVFAGSQCFQGLEYSSTPTSGTVFQQVRGLFSR